MNLLTGSTSRASYNFIHHTNVPVASGNMNGKTRTSIVHGTYNIGA
jgi:hypothetical protein